MPTEGVTLTLTDELQKRSSRGRPAIYSEEQRKERAKLTSKAQTMALAVLRERHREEYDDLFRQAKTEVGL